MYFLSHSYCIYRIHSISGPGARHKISDNLSVFFQRINGNARKIHLRNIRCCAELQFSADKLWLLCFAGNFYMELADFLYCSPYFWADIAMMGGSYLSMCHFSNECSSMDHVKKEIAETDRVRVCGSFSENSWKLCRSLSNFLSAILAINHRFPLSLSSGGVPFYNFSTYHKSTNQSIKQSISQSPFHPVGCGKAVWSFRHVVSAWRRGQGQRSKFRAW